MEYDVDKKEKDRIKNKVRKKNNKEVFLRD